MPAGQDQQLLRDILTTIAGNADTAARGFQALSEKIDDKAEGYTELRIAVASLSERFNDHSKELAVFKATATPILALMAEFQKTTAQKIDKTDDDLQAGLTEVKAELTEVKSVIRSHSRTIKSFRKAIIVSALAGAHLLWEGVKMFFNRKFGA